MLPTFCGFWAQWAHKTERSRLISITLSGSWIGNVSYWPSIFYILGTVGIIWTLLWIIFASDSPETNRFISNKERDYILKSTNIDLNNQKKL